MNTVEKLLKEQFGDLSAESLTAVVEAFDVAVEEKAKLQKSADTIKQYL